MLHHGHGLGWTRGIDLDAQDTADPSPDELGAGIAATRVLVADDAGALSVSNVEAPAGERMRGGEQNLGVRFAGFVRKHPLPFTVAGAAALGLLAWRSRR